MIRSLSVIIPSFNRPAQTARAVASACASAPPDCEILVVDDGSEPALATATLPSDSRVSLIRHTNNRGAAAARNAGLAAATGEWVAFLDSDDIWPEGAFAQRWAHARAANAPPLTVFVCGFSTRSQQTGAARTRFPRSSRDPLWFASGCWFCPGSTALFRRQPVLEAVGPQDETLRRLEDLDWFLRLALAGGGVEAAPIMGAEIAGGAPRRVEDVRAARTRLLHKHAMLAPALRRGLDAHTRLELARALLGVGAWARASGELTASWFLAPRTRPALQPFWATS